jgi:hypothetical protein
MIFRKKCPRCRRKLWKHAGPPAYGLRWMYTCVNRKCTGFSCLGGRMKAR